MLSVWAIIFAIQAKGGEQWRCRGLAVTCISRVTEPRALSLLRSIDKVACKQTRESEQPTA